MSEWISVKEKLPENQNFKKERRRYMALSPRFDGVAFRCWYKDGFGCDTSESMISDVTHYRIAKKSEYEYQLDDDELKSLP